MTHTRARACGRTSLSDNVPAAHDVLVPNHQALPQAYHPQSRARLMSHQQNQKKTSNLESYPPIVGGLVYPRSPIEAEPPGTCQGHIIQNGNRVSQTASSLRDLWTRHPHALPTDLAAKGLRI